MEHAARAWSCEAFSDGEENVWTFKFSTGVESEEMKESYPDPTTCKEHADLFYKFCLDVIAINPKVFEPLPTIPESSIPLWHCMKKQDLLLKVCLTNEWYKIDDLRVHSRKHLE